MGPLGLAIIALAGWLWWTGRLKRMTANDLVAAGFALVSVVLAVRGKPLIAAAPALLSGLYTLWRFRKPAVSVPAHPAQGADMSLVEARALLGVDEGADAEAIRLAHRRLIALTHPDRGGTEALARNINAARDVLLRHHTENMMSHRRD